MEERVYTRVYVYVYTCVVRAYVCMQILFFKKDPVVICVLSLLEVCVFVSS